MTREAHVAACETLSILSREEETLPSASEVRNRETRGSKTTQRCWKTSGSPWQCIPERFLGISRTSCCKLPHWRRTSDYAVTEYYTVVLERPPASHVTVNYHKMALEEHTRQKSRTKQRESNTRWTMANRARRSKRARKSCASRNQESVNETGKALGEESKEQCQQQADKSSANSRQIRAVPTAGR